MTSLFQGLVNADGKVRATLSDPGPGSSVRGGIAVAGNRVVHMSTSAAIASRNGGVPIANNGVVCVETDVGASPTYYPGGLREGDGGRLYCTDTDAPEVIHQGVGVRNGGRLCLSLEPMATFTANLHNNVASTVGPGTFTRASDGLYLGTDGTWRIAPDNVPRFENDRLLMEPAATNKCENWNANPDEALDGMNLSGDGTLQRVERRQLLIDSGLIGICSDGNVVEIDNTGGAVNGLLVIAGSTGSTNGHTASMWARRTKAVGTGVEVRIQMTGVAGNTPIGTEWARYEFYAPATDSTSLLRIAVNPGFGCEFILNQFEEYPVATSPIVTQGAAASREADELSWASAASFFEQAQGMALATLQPGYSKADQAAALQGILSLDSASSSNLLFVDGSFKSTDGTNTASVATPSFAENDVLRLAVIYGPTGASALQVGYSLNGAAWVWSTAVAYDGGFTLVSALILARAITLPGKYSDVQLFNENKGTAWIEANYS